MLRAIEPRNARVDSDLNPVRPTRRPYRISHTGEEDMRPMAQEISTHPEDHPALGR